MADGSDDELPLSEEDIAFFHEQGQTASFLMRDQGADPDLKDQKQKKKDRDREEAARYAPSVSVSHALSLSLSSPSHRIHTFCSYILKHFLLHCVYRCCMYHNSARSRAQPALYAHAYVVAACKHA